MQAGRFKVPPGGGVEAVVVMQQRRRSQELHGADAGMSHDVQQSEPSKAEADFHEDDAELGHGGVGEGGLDVVRCAMREGAQQRGGATHKDYGGGREGGLAQDGFRAEQKVSPDVYGNGSVENRAGRRGAFHGSRQPAGEGDLRGFTGGSE